jgi:hypothetical protein
MASDKNKKYYKSVLTGFLSRRNGVDYNNDSDIPVEVISGISEVDVLLWLRYKAYGKEDPGEGYRLFTYIKKLFHHSLQISTLSGMSKLVQVTQPCHL